MLESPRDLLFDSSRFTDAAVRTADVIAMCGLQTAWREQCGCWPAITLAEASSKPMGCPWEAMH